MQPTPTVEDLTAAMEAGDLVAMVTVAKRVPAARSEASPVVKAMARAIGDRNHAAADALIGAHPQLSAWMTSRAISDALKGGDLDYACDLMCFRKASFVPVATFMLRAAEAMRADLVRKLSAHQSELLSGQCVQAPMKAALQRGDSATITALIEVGGGHLHQANARAALVLAIRRPYQLPQAAMSSICAYDQGNGYVVAAAIAESSAESPLSPEQAEVVGQALAAWGRTEAELMALQDVGFRGVLLHPSAVPPIRAQVRRLRLSQHVVNSGPALFDEMP